MWSNTLQVCVGDNSTYLGLQALTLTEDLLTNLINISLVKFKHFEKMILPKANPNAPNSL